MMSMWELTYITPPKSVGTFLWELDEDEDIEFDF